MKLNKLADFSSKQFGSPLKIMKKYLEIYNKKLGEIREKP